MWMGPHLSKMAPTPALWALFRWTCSPVARRIPSFTAMDRWEKEAMSSSFQPGRRRAQGHAAVSRPRGHPSPDWAAIQRQRAPSQDHPKVGAGEPLRGQATETRFPSTYVWEMLFFYGANCNKGPERSCTQCPLWLCLTQVVPNSCEGSSHKYRVHKP